MQTKAQKMAELTSQAMEKKKKIEIEGKLAEEKIRQKLIDDKPYLIQKEYERVLVKIKQTALCCISGWYYEGADDYDDGIPFLEVLDMLVADGFQVQKSTTLEETAEIENYEMTIIHPGKLYNKTVALISW